MTVRYVDDRIHDSTLHWCQFWNHNETFTRSRTINMENVREITVRIAGYDIRQKLEFHHVHLELGALGYIQGHHRIL